MIRASPKKSVGIAPTDFPQNMYSLVAATTSSLL